jgi:hypothetical protein
VPRYAVHLEVRTDRPLTQQRLDGLDGGRHQMVATGTLRSHTMNVTLEIDGGDVAGALARSLNVILDTMPGDVCHAEVTKLRPGAVARPRRRRTTS